MELVAAGRTARIFRMDDQRVLKRYDDPVSREAIGREVAAMALARQRGLSVPEPGPLVQHEGRWGYTMPYVAGQSGMQRLYAGADTETEARATARLQVQVHAKSGVGLPDYRSLLAASIAAADPLTAHERSAARALLTQLPGGDALVHGDFHPGNVLWSDDGPVIVDWVMAGAGDPVADVARSLVLFGYGMPCPDAHRIFHEAYLTEYHAATRCDVARLDDWLLVQRAARLSEHAESQPERLAALVARSLGRASSKK